MPRFDKKPEKQPPRSSMVNAKKAIASVGKTVRKGSTNAKQ